MNWRCQKMLINQYQFYWQILSVSGYLRILYYVAKHVYFYVSWKLSLWPGIHQAFSLTGCCANDDKHSLEMALPWATGESAQGIGPVAGSKGKEEAGWGRTDKFPHPNCVSHLVNRAHRVHGPHQGTQWCMFSIANVDNSSLQFWVCVGQFRFLCWKLNFGWTVIKSES